MNISNVSSASNTYQPQAPVNTRPKQAADHDGDSDDRAGSVSAAKTSAPAEAAESGTLDVKA